MWISRVAPGARLTRSRGSESGAGCDGARHRWPEVRASGQPVFLGDAAVNETDWLIAATASGPFVGGLVTAAFTGALRQLATARARRVRYIPASGTSLYRDGVPLTEAQFREVFAAHRAALDELPPPAERDEWDTGRGRDAVRRLAVLAGTHPQAFPLIADPDHAWEWYAANNRYATRAAQIRPRRRWAARLGIARWSSSVARRAHNP